MSTNRQSNKSGTTSTQTVKIVRDKADTRPISEQINEICEKLPFTVGAVRYDRNYFIIEELDGEHKTRP